MEFPFFHDMRTIKIVIAYDGTCYAGWQRQNERQTVQEVLEVGIGVMTGEKVTVHGAGRTDAGVHALAMTAHFLTDSSIPCGGFLRGLNSILPVDIRVLAVEESTADFHARFCALGKAYLYNFIIGSVLLPTERLYTVNLPLEGIFNREAVSECLVGLVGKHDFSSFEAVGSRDLKIVGGLGAVREIFSADLLEKNQQGHYAIEISGSGFLRHMVRNIVGTIFEVGSGKLSVQRFQEIVQARDRSLAGPTAPARGLFLKEVFY